MGRILGLAGGGVKMPPGGGQLADFGIVLVVSPKLPGPSRSSLSL